MARLTLSFKEKTLKLIALDVPEITVGSDPACQLHVDSLALQPRHALLQKTPDGWVVRDLDTLEGTFVNEQRVTEQRLQHGDVIRIGKHTLIFHHDLDEAQSPFSGPRSAGDAESGKKAWLQILNGQNVGKTISLNRSLTNLGRAGYQTAVIARRNEGFFLSHLEGDQAPLVGGESIGERSHELKDGDVIQIGNVRMHFYLE